MRFRTGRTVGSILVICAWEVHVGTTTVKLTERMRRTPAPRHAGPAVVKDLLLIYVVALVYALNLFVIRLSYLGGRRQSGRGDRGSSGRSRSEGHFTRTHKRLFRKFLLISVFSISTSFSLSFF